MRNCLCHSLPRTSRWRRIPALVLSVLFLHFGTVALAQDLFFSNAVVHTVSGRTLTNGSVLIQRGKIARVFEAAEPRNSMLPEGTHIVDLQGQHLYPGLVALNSALGLTEIDAVRATQDSTEVGDYTPDVYSWIAVNADSELLPVARANGIGYFEPVPKGGVVSGQSALLRMDGWTYEEMTIKAPSALHLFWPAMTLDLTPKERSREPDKWKFIEEQAKERRAKLRALQDFFNDARAYAKAKNAGLENRNLAPEQIPAWEAMLPYARGELPIVIHADDVRQIKAAVEWARTNRLQVAIAGGRDAWRIASLLGTNRIPVIFEHTFTQPVHSGDPYDVHFNAPAVLSRAGVRVVFSTGPGGFGATMARNLPYAAAQAAAFGLPREDALKAITLYPAEILGVADRLGSIEPGKEATLFVCDGDILDLRRNVTRMWIAGREVSLENRHTRLYDRFRQRPDARERRQDQE